MAALIARLTSAIVASGRFMSTNSDAAGKARDQNEAFHCRCPVPGN
jgi:hypothetical protein